jgi:hypothetical protein
MNTFQTKVPRRHFGSWKKKDKTLNRCAAFWGWGRGRKRKAAAAARRRRKIGGTSVRVPGAARVGAGSGAETEMKSISLICYHSVLSHDSFYE